MNEIILDIIIIMSINDIMISVNDIILDMTTSVVKSSWMRLTHPSLQQFAFYFGDVIMRDSTNEILSIDFPSNRKYERFLFTVLT